jgi:hypothetical protein
MGDKGNDRIPAYPMKGVPPAEAEVLLADLAPWNQEHKAGMDGDFELLALIVEEAACDVDIPQRFPTFWRKMMADAELYEAFLDCLELLEASRGMRLRTGSVAGTRMAVKWNQADAGLDSR